MYTVTVPRINAKFLRSYRVPSVALSGFSAWVQEEYRKYTTSEEYSIDAPAEFILQPTFPVCWMLHERLADNVTERIAVVTVRGDAYEVEMSCQGQHGEPTFWRVEFAIPARGVDFDAVTILGLVARLVRLFDAEVNGSAAITHA